MRPLGHLPEPLLDARVAARGAYLASRAPPEQLLHGHPGHCWPVCLCSCCAAVRLRLAAACCGCLCWALSSLHSCCRGLCWGFLRSRLLCSFLVHAFKSTSSLKYQQLALSRPSCNAVCAEWGQAVKHPLPRLQTWTTSAIKNLQMCLDVRLAGCPCDIWLRLTRLDRQGWQVKPGKLLSQILPGYPRMIRDDAHGAGWRVRETEVAGDAPAGVGRPLLRAPVREQSIFIYGTPVLRSCKTNQATQRQA